MTETLIRIRDFGLTQAGAAKPAIEGFSLTLEPGGTLTLLGETGSGKGVILRMLAQPIARGMQTSGAIQVRDGAEQPIGRSMTLDLRIAYLPGPHANVLNQNVSVLSQLLLIVARKLRQPKASARAELAAALERFPGAPALEMLDYPPRLIAPEVLAIGFLATAVAQTPDLLLADDPLGELSPVHARAVVSALKAEQKRLGFALLYSAARAEAANLLGGNLVVLRSGAIVEEGPFARLSTAQSHAYTQTLFRSLSAAERQSPDRSAARGEPLLRVQGVQLVTRGKPSARDKLNFELRRGASLALIGEIGSGRRALARALLGLDRVAGGRIVFDQVDIGVLNAAMMARLRSRVAFITGDDDALDPRMTIFDTVSEPLRAHLAMPRDLMAHNRDAALKRVGLAALPGNRTVASLSLFDRRRLQIARAIVSQPLLAVIDEPLRGLDAFAQSVVRDLLRNFRSNEGPALLVVTSDFGLARTFCEDGFVFHDGRVVERGSIPALLRAPQDPHTRKLLEAVAVLPATAEPEKPSAILAEAAPPAPEA
ncbi:MAG: ATP-binding cassette domain-containing protein [Proteobacteria bacterium]|nr:ATP-binding cassette domain-containing protein [Pseudomonadota bacterium]